MSISPLHISAQSEDDLRMLSEQAPDKIEGAYAKAASIQGQVIAPKALREAMEGELSPNVVRALIRQLVGLRSYIDEAEIPPSEAVQALSQGVKEKDWPEAIYQKWEIASKIFERFLSLENIVTITKALELSLDFEHILISSKILTDIRPVYSATRDKIVGGIVCNRLRIKFHDEDAHKSISISIDKDEIEHLQKLCSDALKKIEMASSLLKRAGLPSFVTGEGYDEWGGLS